MMSPPELEAFAAAVIELRHRFQLNSLMFVGVDQDGQVVMAGDVCESLRPHMSQVLHVVAADIEERLPLLGTAESRPN